MESSLFEYLSSVAGITSLVGTRIYPHHIPQGTNAFPLLTLQTISVTHEHVLSEAAGVATARVQIDSWGRTLEDVLQLAEAVRQALQGFGGEMEETTVHFVQLATDMNLHEPPTDGSEAWLYRRVQDYLIKYQESVPEF